MIYYKVDDWERLIIVTKIKIKKGKVILLIIHKNFQLLLQTSKKHYLINLEFTKSLYSF
jgi:hypothetical protein